VGQLSRLGVLQACVSNSRRVTVDANIAALGIAENILFSVSLVSVAKRLFLCRGMPFPQ
jgi:hypothetical protein